MNPHHLAQALLSAVRAQDFGNTPDALLGGAPVAQFPSIDLAVAAFPHAAPPVWANVLFSREHPQGVVADIGADAGPVRNVQYLADQRDAALMSTAWLPGSDWQQMAWQPLAGSGPHRFVAPYPASLLKLMVAAGVAIAVDAGVVDWLQLWVYQGHRRSVDAWCEDMIVSSDNDATSAMVALLHAARLLGPQRNVLHARFEALGLHTLRLEGTQADGGWGNAAGAGVGGIQMTAWDTVRLLWLLDPQAPPAPWRGGQPVLCGAGCARLMGWLQGQGLHEILSSTLLAGMPGFVAGLPARLPARWVAADGSAQVGEHIYPADVRPANARAQVEFLHKTGTTENYASDAGIVRGLAPQRRHYTVALLSNLGRRYAPDERCATTWRLPALGAALDAALKPWLEGGPAASA